MTPQGSVEAEKLPGASTPRRRNTPVRIERPTGTGAHEALTMLIRSFFVLLSAPVALMSAEVGARTLTACPAGVDKGCDFTGHSAIQTAIDRAADGDVVLVRAGVYTPERFTDIAYKQYVLRGAIAIQHKRIAVQGEEGAVIDGASGPPVCAVVVNGGEVTLTNLVLRNLRAGDREDDLYEGHGIFAVDAVLNVRDVTIEKYQKMGLIGRGSSLVTASNVRIQDGHVAIWLEESSHLRLCNSVVRNNDSAGVAAYASSSASIYNSVFDRHLDDALYADDDASLSITNSLVLNSKPYGVRVVGNARAVARHSVFFGNEAKASSPEGKQSIVWGPGIFEADPKVSSSYSLPMPLDGDPDVRTAEFGKSRIGLSSVAACR
ncbi:MAG TPA: right-handed parallel beta-helix repeat-containing protein [Steroidobacter sp.]